MNMIKSKTRNRIKEILMSLLLIYTAHDEGKAELDFSKNIMSCMIDKSEEDTRFEMFYMGDFLNPSKFRFLSTGTSHITLKK